MLAVRRPAPRREALLGPIERGRWDNRGRSRRRGRGSTREAPWQVEGQADGVGHGCGQEGGEVCRVEEWQEEHVAKESEALGSLQGHRIIAVTQCRNVEQFVVGFGPRIHDAVRAG